MAPSAVSPPPAVAPPVKTRSILRKRSHESSSQSDGRPTPSKRARFAFEPVLESPGSRESEAHDAAVLREQVAYALSNNRDSAKEKYEQIKTSFDEPLDGEDALSSGALRAHLVALASNAPLLKPSSADLVNAVLHHHWLGRDDTFVADFTRFLGHLVSAQGGYLPTVLKMLVSNFAHASESAGKYPTHTLPKRSKLRFRIHAALRYLLQLIPSASGVLSSILSSSFPFFDDNKRAHVDYVRNLLHVTEYAPELKAVVLDLIVDRLLKIDVQVQKEVEELQEDVEELLMQGQNFKAASKANKLDEDDEDDELSDEEASDSSDDEDDLDADTRRLNSVKSSVEKMDAIMDLLFSYHDPILSKSQSNNHIEALSTFNQLLAQFRKTILPTYRSRHTQFLLFHFAQASSEFASSFTDTCMQILSDKSRFSALRVSAAAYLATFIARGAHVEADLVVYVFNSLAQLADRLRKTHESTCRHPDMRKYSPYYATIQALLYIFCFRWRDLVAPSSLHSDPDADASDDDESGENAIDAAVLDRNRALIFLPLAKDAFVENFNSRLNPLKVCAPEIVEEFAKIAHHLNFMYVYPTLEVNRRVRLAQSLASTDPSSAIGARETSLSLLRGERACQLDAYFPFDPYHLPKSKRWLLGDYREWKGVPGLRDERFPESTDVINGGAEDDSDEDLEDEDSDDEDQAVGGIDEDMDEEEERTATPGDEEDFEEHSDAEDDDDE